MSEPAVPNEPETSLTAYKVRVLLVDDQDLFREGVKVIVDA